MAIPATTVATTNNDPLETRLGERPVEVLVVEIITGSSDLGRESNSQDSEILRIILLSFRTL